MPGTPDRAEGGRGLEARLSGGRRPQLEAGPESGCAEGEIGNLLAGVGPFAVAKLDTPASGEGDVPDADQGW